MNLSELVSIAAQSTGLPPKQVRQVLDNVFQTIEGSLLQGDAVRTPFGTFTVKQRAAKKGWNMHTNQTIDIPPAKVVKFSASRAIKASVNSGKKTTKKAASTK